MLTSACSVISSVKPIASGVQKRSGALGRAPPAKNMNARLRRTNQLFADHREDKSLIRIG